MKTKQIPVIIMLLAGLVTCMDSIIQRAPLSAFVTRMWVVLILFYILGIIVKVVLDKNFTEKKIVDDEAIKDQDVEQAVDHDGEINEREKEKDTQQEG